MAPLHHAAAMPWCYGELTIGNCDEFWRGRQHYKHHLTSIPLKAQVQTDLHFFMLSLWDCGLSDRSCVYLVFVLEVHPAPALAELDLLRNDLTDVGIRALRDFQRRPGHRLRILGLTEESAAAKLSDPHRPVTPPPPDEPSKDTVYSRSLEGRNYVIFSSNQDTDVDALKGQSLQYGDSTGDSFNHDVPEITEQKTITSPTSPSLSECLWEEPQPAASNWMEETVFFPEVSSESDLSYRFRCPSSGAFCCSSTELVFVVTKEADLLYRTVQWNEALLHLSARIPAGPLYDIECPQRAVFELHLPHCEPQTDLSQSSLSVAHISDSGLSLIRPQQITETHVVIPVSGLSQFGLVAVWQWLFKPQAVSGQVMLFRTPREQSTKKLMVNVFLLPRNISVDQVRKNKEWITTQYIIAPYACTLVRNRHYSLDCPGADIVQPKRALFDMDNEPNYHPTFELHLPPESTLVFLTVREEGSSEQTEVWTHQLDLTVTLLSRPYPSSTLQTDPKTLLRLFRRDIVNNVSDAVLNQLLDRLLQERVLTSEEMDSAKEKTRAEKARHVVDTVIKKGLKAASVLIQEYCDLDPMAELCEQLRPQL